MHLNFPNAPNGKARWWKGGQWIVSNRCHLCRKVRQRELNVRVHKNKQQNSKKTMAKFVRGSWTFGSTDNQTASSRKQRQQQTDRGKIHNNTIATSYHRERTKTDRFPNGITLFRWCGMFNDRVHLKTITAQRSTMDEDIENTNLRVTTKRQYMRKKTQVLPFLSQSTSPCNRLPSMWSKVFAVYVCQFRRQHVSDGFLHMAS